MDGVENNSSQFECITKNHLKEKIYIRPECIMNMMHRTNYKRFYIEVHNSTETLKKTSKFFKFD